MTAQVGDLVPAAGGGWMVLAPTHCPAGHPLTARRVEVGHRACSDGRGHTTWRCLVCHEVVYAPALVEACSLVTGPG